MSILIAVINCHTRQIYQDAVRETWLPLVQGADVRFFRGRGATREPLPDEVFLDCGDDYASLPDKVRAIARWALEHSYIYMVKLDDDVIIKPHQLIVSIQGDFIGHRNDVRPFPVPFGFCYTLSARSMKLVADAELPVGNNDEVWVTDTLAKEGIVLRHNPKYVMYTGKQEDFAASMTRPLRAPPRSKFIRSVEDPFAWCMYLCYGPGYRNIPDERVVEEMKKLFKEVTQ